MARNSKKNRSKASQEELYISKQIKPQTSDGTSKETSIVKSKRRELEDIHMHNKELYGDITHFSTGLDERFDPETIKLPEATSSVDIRRSATQLQLYGDSNKNQALSDVVNNMLEDQARRITGYMHTGVYGRIELARKCDFILNNLPILGESTRLFIDDVNNGSFVGDVFQEENKFRIYENGVQVNDSRRIKKILNILNPKEYSIISKDVKPWNEIDNVGITGAWMYGCKCIKVLSNKKIAQDLYIKYVMKKAKVDNAKNKEVKTQEMLVPKTESAMSLVKSIDYSESLYTVIDNKILLDDTSIALKNTRDWKGFEIVTEHFLGNKPISNYDYNEYTHGNESFTEFVTRVANESHLPIYSISDKNGDKPLCNFSVDIGGVSARTVGNILAELERMPKAIDNDLSSVSLESITSLSPAEINKFDESLSFADIYAFNTSNASGFTSMVYNKIGTECGFDLDMSKSFGLESISNDVDRVFGIEVGDALANVGSAQSQSQFPSPNTGATKDPLTGASLDAEERLKQSNISYGRISKTFESIKGDTIEYLDNTRTIPIVVGDRLLGVIYIEFTHQDVEHYVGLRHMMTNPTGYMAEMDTLNINYEEQEETLGRLMFIDNIKPIIDKHMSVKFLKNNSDILGVIYRLLREHEVSTSSTLTDLQRSAIYNMSRIVFVPIDDIVFYRNGHEYLGESQYEKALGQASSVILVQDKYMGWLMQDAAGYTFIEVPKGLSEASGENGTNPLVSQIIDTRMTRYKLRDMSFSNADVSAKMIIYEKPEDVVSALDIKQVKPDSFHIDQEIITRWIQEATEIVGYNAALFSSQDGSVELARKLAEMHNAKKLVIDELRRFKIPASSQLATKLLRIRGGEEFNNTVVIWNPPELERKNTTTATEKIKESSERFAAYMELADSKYGEDNDEYQLNRSRFANEVLMYMMPDDPIVMAMDELLQKAIQKTKIDITTKVVETSGEEEEVQDGEA